MLRARLIYEIKYEIIKYQKNNHNLGDKMNKRRVTMEKLYINNLLNTHKPQVCHKYIFNGILLNR